ncbi:MAG: hypothetical protein ACO3FQ_01160 [Terrimicrobiaceae bacterium]
MEAYFTELGNSVYTRWKKANFSLEAFPEIAVKALKAKPAFQHVDLQKFTRDFLLHDEQPFQSVSGFGQPELIVYDNPKFYIQALFWLDGTTDIHQHEFSGAFQVFKGSSIHSRYAFENAEPITAHFRLGDLKLQETRLLECGDTVPIVSGRACIHSLFHLETPSVTIVIRTHSDPGTGPQFTYLPPHLAVDPVQGDSLTLRRKQLLDVLERTGSFEYPGLVLKMIGLLDFERGFFVLQNAQSHLQNLGVWDEVWAAFSKKHGALAKPVLPTLLEILRRDALVAMRATIEDPDHRFLLALLLNLESREAILAMVAQRYPGDPLKNIFQWALEMTVCAESGTWILDAEFPAVIALPPEEQVSLFPTALNHFLSGGKTPPELKSISKKHLTRLRGAFESSAWRVLLK